ncbi:hypothetical protein SAY87_005224 [Trapa incisa]|uniref:DUF7903 domain-containing protein n=1 Tax=Trapa incisa TaxID=236973 RepID=A0AAN7K5H1_9MYRT|nr:hypothetical protein SAY87_005224 [Trapa incisa]
MSYVPPHKRADKESAGLRLTPAILEPQKRRNLNPGSSRTNIDKSGRIVYSNSAISKWFIVGLDGDGQIPPSVLLQPVRVDSVERVTGEKPLALVKNSPENGGGLNQDNPEQPWVYIAENVLHDLLSSFENVMSGRKEQHSRDSKPTLVAKVGTILFHGSRKSSIPEDPERTLLSESLLRQFRRTFYTNIPSSYMENVMNNVASKIGVDFEQSKDLYNVKLSDKSQPKATISCKCRVREEGQRLQVFKIEMNPIRHMVADVSCLGKNLDLRLMLTTKTILTDLCEDEMAGIEELISSVVIDPNVKGGLRWPLGKQSSRDRFEVIGVWHTSSRAYSSPTLRLKVRNADRFDFRTSAGEATGEVSLKLKGIASELLGSDKLDSESNRGMILDAIKLLWEQFLQSDKVLT